LGLKVFLVAVREALCLAIAPSYDTTGASGKGLFWLSPLADQGVFANFHFCVESAYSVGRPEV